MNRTYPPAIRQFIVSCVRVGLHVQLRRGMASDTPIAVDRVPSGLSILSPAATVVSVAASSPDTIDRKQPSQQTSAAKDPYAPIAMTESAWNAVAAAQIGRGVKLVLGPVIGKTTDSSTRVLIGNTHLSLPESRPVSVSDRAGSNNDLSRFVVSVLCCSFKHRVGWRLQSAGDRFAGRSERFQSGGMRMLAAAAAASTRNL